MSICFLIGCCWKELTLSLSVCVTFTLPLTWTREAYFSLVVQKPTMNLSSRPLCVDFFPVFLPHVLFDASFPHSFVLCLQLRKWSMPMNALLHLHRWIATPSHTLKRSKARVFHSQTGSARICLKPEIEFEPVLVLIPEVTTQMQYLFHFKLNYL